MVFVLGTSLLKMRIVDFKLIGSLHQDGIYLFDFGSVQYSYLNRTYILPHLFESVNLYNPINTCLLRSIIYLIKQELIMFNT